MEKTFLELDERKCRNYYIKMFNIFQKYINNSNEIFDFGIRFGWDMIKLANEEFAKECDAESTCVGSPLADFYFRYEGKYYALDISDDFERFGYANPYFYNDNLFMCEIREYYNVIEYEGKRLSMTFVYDKKANKVIEIFELMYYYPQLYGQYQTIKEGNKQSLQRILKQRTNN